MSIGERTNDSSLVKTAEEEIRLATRNAYLYATGLTVLSFVLAVMNAWVFYLGGTTGMKFRVLLTAAIYDKVNHYVLCVELSWVTCL